MDNNNIEQLKDNIREYIKQNGNKEITGQILQEVLLGMVDGLVGNDAVANPEGEATETMVKLKIGETIYGIPQTNLPKGLLYGGEVYPNTVITPDIHCYYIANGSGNYISFGNALVGPAERICYLYYDESNEQWDYSEFDTYKYGYAESKFNQVTELGESTIQVSSAQNFTNAERIQALANVSNQEAGYDDSTLPVFTGKMGYVVLQPQDDEDLEHTLFAAQIANKPNTIFEIRDVFDFGDPNGENPITIPANCVLKFNGGALKNGSLSCSTPISIENPSDGKVFYDVTSSERITMLFVKTSWFGNTTSEIKKGLDMLIYSAVEINGDITFDGTTLTLWSVNNYICKNAKITAPVFETEKEVVHLFVDWLPIDLSNMRIVLCNGFKGVAVAIYSTFSGEYNSRDEYLSTSRNKFSWNDIYLPKVNGEYVDSGNYLYYNKSDDEYTNKSIGVVIRPGNRNPYSGDNISFNSMFFNHFHVSCEKVTVACQCDTVEFVDNNPITYTNYYTVGKITISSWICAIAFEQESNLGDFEINIYHQCNLHTDKVVKCAEPWGNDSDNGNVATYYIKLYDVNEVPSEYRSNLIDNTRCANYLSNQSSFQLTPVSFYFSKKSNTIEYSYALGGQNFWKYQPMVLNSIENMLYGTYPTSQNIDIYTELANMVDKINSLNFRRNVIVFSPTGQSSYYRSFERVLLTNYSDLISSDDFNTYQAEMKLYFYIPRRDTSVQGCNIHQITTELYYPQIGIRFTNFFKVTYNANNGAIVALVLSKREGVTINTMSDYYKLYEGETAFLKSHNAYVQLKEYNLHYLNGDVVLPINYTEDDVKKSAVLGFQKIILSGLEYQVTAGTRKKIRFSLANIVLPEDSLNVTINLYNEESRTISVNTSVNDTPQKVVDYLCDYFNSHYNSSYYAYNPKTQSRLEFLTRKYDGNDSNFVSNSKIVIGSTEISATNAANGVLSACTIRNITKYPESGTLASRPTITEGAALTGFRYFATDVHKWITWDGTDWYYDDGTQVS